MMNNYYVLPALVDAACCAVLCFCCIRCLKTKGAGPLPWPWLPIVLAVVGIPVTLWAFQNNRLTLVNGVLLFPFRPNNLFFVPGIKTVSLFKFLSLAGHNDCLGHVLSRLACLGAAVLAPIAIFLYQRNMKKNP